MNHRRTALLLLAAAALTPAGVSSVAANPAGSAVGGGAAVVSGEGSANVTVNQSTDKAIINWNTFNIGNGEATTFVQPSTDSVTLNRVTGGLGRSSIDGALKANGKVFLINPDGIMFGQQSIVDVGGLVATTHDIGDDDFMSGRYVFSQPGNAAASIVNAGTITAASGGFAALVAPGVRNAGVISARLGKLGLAAGNGFTLDFYGDQLLTLSVSDEIAAEVRDVQTGEKLDALVKNEGALKADGGVVQLTAAAARKVVDSVINNKGVIEANSVGLKNGKIVLGGATATKPANAPAQKVKVAGKLSAAGKKPGESGGKVQITGEEIALVGATIDASGAAGGGTVLIGGDVGGGNANPNVVPFDKGRPEVTAVPTATTVSADAATVIDASATTSGNGGKVVVWADYATMFPGNIRARGGASGGDGGFVEVSGKQLLDFTGSVDLLAPFGLVGTLLLDPGSIIIQASGSTTTGISSGGPGTVVYTGVNPTSVLALPVLQLALALGNVVVSTGDFGPNSNFILVDTPISWTTGTTLTLQDAGLIAIVQPITAVNGGLTIAGSDSATSTASINVGTFNLARGAWIQAPLSPSTQPAFQARDFQITGGTFLRANGGNGSASNPYRVTDVYGLKGIAGFAKHFVLANDLDLGVVDWSFGISNFGGHFDGLGRTLSNSRSALFNSVDAGSTVQNIRLSNFHSLGTTLAGINFGTIRGVTASGVVTGLGAGGLVGFNGGLIENSSANVSVSGPFGVGGLASANNGTIKNSFASGDVVASGSFAFAGGLVGSSGKQSVIEDSFAMGDVSVSLVGSFNDELGAGGLVGATTGGVINRSYATGNVLGGPSSYVGGLVGLNGAAIDLSYATGRVTAGDGTDAKPTMVGGLVGVNLAFIEFPIGPNFWGTINRSYATGSVAAGSKVAAGGLVGVSGGAIAQAFSLGSVNAGSNSYVGAFIGINAANPAPENGPGSILQAYSTGTVTGGAASYVGGFVGVNAGTIQQAYATGAVNSVGGSRGGFAGSNVFNVPGAPFTLPGSTFSAYWDKSTTGLSTSAGGIGRTTAQLASALPSGFDASVWRVAVGSTPTFRGNRAARSHGWEPVQEA